MKADIKTPDEKKTVKKVPDMRGLSEKTRKIIADRIRGEMLEERKRSGLNGYMIMAARGPQDVL